jgi:type VII secretion protein EssB
MGDTIRREVKNSALKTPKNKLSVLSYPAESLVPCATETTEEGVAFVFDIRRLRESTAARAATAEEKYRFLANCARLETLFAEYDFSLDPENLMMDINLRPLVLSRDVQTESEGAFLPRYKALAGAILSAKYSYADYIEGGGDLYQKKEVLAEAAAQPSAESLGEYFFELYETEREKNRREKIAVRRGSLLAGRILIPVLALALALAGFFGYRAMVQDIPYRDSLIEAHALYLQENYLGVQRALEDIPAQRLDSGAMYVLARSYIITEGLSDEQKANVLAGLSYRSDPLLLEYWIELGRLRFETAVDIAERLGDDDLLLFAYMKWELSVRSSVHLTGAEKSELLKTLDEKIQQLIKSRENAASGAGTGAGG